MSLSLSRISMKTSKQNKAGVWLGYLKVFLAGLFGVAVLFAPKLGLEPCLLMFGCLVLLQRHGWLHSLAQIIKHLRK